MTATIGHRLLLTLPSKLEIGANNTVWATSAMLTIENVNNHGTHD